MANREFLVPSDEEILDALGVVPEVSVDDPMVQVVRVSTASGDVVSLSYDVVGRSVRCQWNRDSIPLVDLFREAATELTVESGHGVARLVVRFETEVLGGELDIQVYPAVRVNDRLLFR